MEIEMPDTNTHILDAENVQVLIDALKSVNVALFELDGNVTADEWNRFGEVVKSLVKITGHIRNTYDKSVDAHASVLDGMVERVYKPRGRKAGAAKVVDIFANPLS